MGSEPSYAIAVSGNGNRVTATSNEGETVFEIRSDTGLGSAEIEQISGQPPSKLIMQLHLRGLEEFDFKYGDVTVRLAVSSHGDNAVSEQVLRDGSGETPIGPDSPYWMPVEVVTASGSSDQATGFFSVQAPVDYVQGKYRAFSMKWIDFYR
jgi:hypothetical protein